MALYCMVIKGDANDPNGNYHFSPGQYLVMYSASDDALNTSVCAFEISVLDKSIPEITCPAISGTISTNAEDCFKTFDSLELLPVATDNCLSTSLRYRITGPVGPAVFGTGIPVNYDFEPGIYTLTYIVEDLSGNIDSCELTFFIADFQPPVFQCYDDFFVNPASGGSTANVNIPPLVSDNCGLNGVSYNIILPNGGLILGGGNASSTNFPFGTSTVTYTATDVNGNNEDCTFQVTVNPISPVCPVGLPTTYLDMNCIAQIDPSVVPNGFFSYLPDSSANIIVTFLGNGIYTPLTSLQNPNPSSTPFNIINGANLVGLPGEYVVEYIVQAFDSGGILLATNNPCEISMLVLDTIPPEMACPADMTLAVNDELGLPGNCPLTPSNLGYDMSVTVNEACGIASVEYFLVDEFNVLYSSGLGDASSATFRPGKNEVKYRITDESGNIDSCVFEVNVLLLDNTPPVLNCPADITIQLQSTNGCDSLLQNNELRATAFDLCYVNPLPSAFYMIKWPDATVTGPFSGLDASNGMHRFPAGESVVTFTAGDGSGNVSICSTRVVIQDNEIPVAVGPCPSNVMIAPFGSTCQAQVFNIDPPPIVDNCPGTGIFYQIAGATNESGMGSASGTNFNVGMSVVSYSAQDQNGNLHQICSFTVFVEDSTPPVISCPADYDLVADNNCTAIAVGSSPMVTDDCGSTEVFYSMVIPNGDLVSGTGSLDGLELSLGTNQIQYFAIDEFGNTSTTCDFQINIVDNTPPSISNCPANITVNADPLHCNQWINFTPIVASDNCSIPEISNDFTPIGNDVSGYYPLGLTNVVIAASDASGNTANCSFNVLVIDDFSSGMMCPNDTVVYTSLSGCAVVVNMIDPGVDCESNTSYLIQFPDNSTVNGIGSASGRIFPKGTTTITYTISDDSNNVLETCSFTIDVIDDSAPVFTSCPASVTINSSACTENVVLTLASAIDNCGVASVQNDFNSGGPNASGVYPLGTTLVTFTASDSDGNQSFCQTVVNILDVGLTISCPSDVTVNNLNDNCGAVVSGLAPIVSGTMCANVNFSWTIFGSNGNVESGNGDVSGHYFHIGENLVRYYLGSGGNALDSCEFSVLINGTPILPTCPSDMTLNVDLNSCAATIGNALIPTDNECNLAMSFSIAGSTTISQTSGTPLGETLNEGANAITYYYLDPFTAAVSQLCEIDVLVQDMENPLLVCLNDVTITTDGQSALQNPLGIVGIGAIQNTNGLCAIELIDLLPVNQSDNCQINALTYNITLPDASIVSSAPSGLNDPSGFDFPVGLSTVTYTLVDMAGNTAHCSFQIDIIDVSSPVVSLCSDIEIQNGNLQMAPAGFMISNNDPCNPTLTNSDLVFLDDCGSIVRVDVIISGATQGQALNTANGGVITGAFVGHTNSNGVNNLDNVQLNVGVSQVQYTAFDESGNQGECVFSIMVNEAISPFFANCPDDVQINTDPGNCTRNFTINPPVVGDNCLQSILQLKYSVFFPANTNNIISSGTNAVQYNFPMGASKVVWRLEDGSGNVASSQCEMLVEVMDNEAPQITCPTPAPVVLNPGQLNCDTILNNLDAFIIDNCDLVSQLSYELTLPDGSVVGPISGAASGVRFPVGTTSVTYFAKDNAGNSMACSFAVNVVDDSPPQIVNCPSDLTVSADSDCEAHVALPAFVVDGGPCSFSNSALDVASHSNGGSPIISTSPGNPTVIVNPVDINISVPGPPYFTIDNVQLDVYLYNVDAEFGGGIATEFFHVVDESGDTLGVTDANSEARCRRSGSTCSSILPNAFQAIFSLQSLMCGF